MVDDAGCPDPKTTDVAAATDSEPQRSSIGRSLLETLKYLKEADEDKTISVRQQDRLSSNLLTLAVLFGILFVVTPWVAPQLQGVSFVSTVMADILLTASLLWFVARRFGVLRTMTKRHAVLCYELMLASGLLFSVLALNVVAIIVLILMGGRILSSLFG